jgi:molybdopterin-guanine dinucleotide biosynthesis protein A
MLAGAVLTGGSSTRMGADKAMVEVDGVAMAARVANALRAAGCAPVALVGGDLETLGRLGETVIADAYPGAGPVGGIITAIRTLGGRADGVVIASCDLAFLGSEHVITLTSGFETLFASGCDVVVARTEPGAQVQPLCAVWRPSALERIEAVFDAGKRSVFGVLDVLDVADIAVPAGGLRNMNSPSDLDGATS